ncbi:MAG: hypothetical protein R6X12_01375 [bacterium]
MRADLLFVAGLLVAGCCLTCCRRTKAADIASAPEAALIDGRTLRPRAELWRDFQPVAPPDGQPMMAIAGLVADDDLPLPEDITIDRLWVLNGDEQWAPKPAAGADRLTVHAADGPKWGPGISVDVVLRIARGKQTWLVRAPGVPIKRTD